MSLRNSVITGLCSPILMFALAACEPLPEGTEKGDLEYFEEAVASIDCELVKSADYHTVQFQADLTREQVLEFASYELGAGRAERIESGGVRLIAGPCAAGGAPVAQAIEIKGGS